MLARSIRIVVAIAVLAPLAGAPWAGYLSGKLAAVDASLHVRVIGEPEIGVVADGVVTDDATRLRRRQLEPVRRRRLGLVALTARLPLFRRRGTAASMKTVTATNLLPCTPDTFWSVFLDERYTRALFLEELGFKELDILELTPTSRKIRVVPKVNLPGPLQKLVGDSFAYEEHGTLDRARNEWTWRMVPRKEIIATRGKVRVEPSGDGQCRRNDEVVVEGKIFGLGGVIESTAEKEVRASSAKELAFFTRWLQQQKSS